MRLWSQVCLMVVVLASLGVAGGPARAGETAEFDGMLAEAWGHYRIALSQAGRANGAATAKGELAAFLGSWKRLQARWGAKPPPQFAEEGEWKDTVDAVGDIAGRALGELDGKASDDVADSLAEIGAVLADLRRRNNVVAFTDYMNEFANQLEEAIAAETPSAKSAKARRDQLAVLRYLAERIQKNAPPAVQQDHDFAKMTENLLANIERARGVAEGKPAELDRALLAIRASFNRLFLRFG